MGKIKCLLSRIQIPVSITLGIVDEDMIFGTQISLTFTRAVSLVAEIQSDPMI